MKANQKWHALFVHTGDEDNVKERLQYKFDEIRVLVPKRKLRERKNGVWETKIRTLFPGYVLINGTVEVEDYYGIKSTPGLIKVLKDKSGIQEIHEQEINIISRLICNGDIIGPSSIFVEGGRIVVIDGPLLGLDGFIESIDKRKGRAKVRVNFIGEPRLVELGINMVQAV